LRGPLVDNKEGGGDRPMHTYISKSKGGKGRHRTQSRRKKKVPQTTPQLQSKLGSKNGEELGNSCQVLLRRRVWMTGWCYKAKERGVKGRRITKGFSKRKT